MAVPIDTIRERILRIGEPNPLVGVLSEPAGDVPSRAPAFLLLNAGILHRVGPSRTNVAVGRALAEEGFAAFRFDFSGIGDSGHRPDARSFDVRSVDEIVEVMDHLEALLDVRRFVVLGLCSGADAAYAVALRDDRVAGLVSLDGHSYRTWKYWLHRYAPRLLRMESWRNLLTGRTYLGPALRRLRNGAAGNGDEAVQGVEVFRRDMPPRKGVGEGYQALADRGVRTLQIFTGGIEGQYNYAAQFREAFSDVDFRDRLRLEFFAEATHTFTHFDDRRRLLATVKDWAAEVWAPASLESVALR